VDDAVTVVAVDKVLVNVGNRGASYSDEKGSVGGDGSDAVGSRNDVLGGCMTIGCVKAAPA
jgi:hypothetical protein